MRTLWIPPREFAYLGVASQLILYAKAFDLARDLLPGYGNSKKEAAFQLMLVPHSANL
jgi:hypothetical protein